MSTHGLQMLAHARFLLEVFRCIGIQNPERWQDLRLSFPPVKQYETQAILCSKLWACSA